jgi:lipoprotein-anchoring transpeptidase ErfK/SrfK
MMNLMVRSRNRGVGAVAGIRLIWLTTLVLAASLIAKDASASVSVQISLSRQQMTVAVNGSHVGTWAVSTARRGYRTPMGTFRPYLLKRMHYSSIYDNAPMPNSIFFLGGYAIHGTTEVRSLGRPVSHGCVRLAPTNARALYTLVQQHGMAGTTIRIIP